MRANSVRVCFWLTSIGLLIAGFTSLSPALADSSSNATHQAPTGPSAATVAKCLDCSSGYILGSTKAGSIFGVSNTFVLPAIPKCTKVNRTSVFDVELDGYHVNSTDTALLDIGEGCAGGAPQLFGGSLDTISGSSTALTWIPSPGSNLTLSIMNRGGLFAWNLTDQTNGSSQSGTDSSTGATMTGATCGTAMTRVGAVHVPQINFGTVVYHCWVSSTKGTHGIGGSFGASAYLIKVVAYNSAGTTPLDRVSRISGHSTFSIQYLRGGP
jgi:hypothetical protein